MAHDAFISYAAEDKATADAACARLEARGIRCWIAPRDVVGGLDWSAEIIDAIAGSRLLVLVFSQSSNESPQVKREVERAVSRGLPVIPFRIEDVPLSKHMEFFISTPHWLDALTPPLDAHLERLGETVAFVLERTGPPTDGGGGVRPRPPEAPYRAPSAGHAFSWQPPPQVQAFEERLVDTLRPLLLRLGASAAGERSVWAVPVALLVGVIGLWSGLLGLFRVLVPGQAEMILFHGFPFLRIANLFGSAAGSVGSLLLLVGADWVLREQKGGRDVALAACRLLAACTLVWFVLAVGSFTSDWNMASVTRLVPATLSLAVTAWVLQAAAYYFMRGRPAPAGAAPTPPESQA